MDKLEKETKKIIDKLSKIEENIKEKLNLPNYHYIELCIIFINYCEELTISKDDFLIANSQITKDDEEEENSNEDFCVKIFNIISTNKPTAPIHALFAYLKSISITDKINTEILFKILDREEKGNIEFDNVETLISNLEEYLDIKEDWNDFIESFKGKKLTMRNLSQGDFITRITNLFDQAEKKIEELAIKSADKYAEEEKPNNFLKLSSNKEDDKNSKNSKSKSKNNISEQSSSNISSSKLFSKKSEKNIENNENENNENENNNIDNDNKDDNNKENINTENKENEKGNNQAIVPYDSFNNNENNNMISNGINLDEVNFDDSLFEKVFDRKKELKIHQIKNTSLLYDITLEEFLAEFQKYEKTYFDKNKFINVFCEIIQKKTSDVFKGPMLRYSLSLLYQFIDSEKKNKLSYYEILGPIIVLTKAKTEERLNMIFSYDNPELISIVCGILSLYLNTDVIKDFSILSEIFVKTCGQLDLRGAQNIFKWIFGNNEDYNLDKNFDFLVEEDSIIEEENTDNMAVNGETIKQLNLLFDKTKFGRIHDFFIIDITNKLLMKYSLLGQMNMHHLNALVDDLLNSKFGEQKSKEKTKARLEFLSFIEKYINFGKTELVDVTLLHSLFILIFSGSTMEKVRSIFVIHDINENELLKTFDFGIYLSHMFHFLLSEMGIDDNNLSNYMGKHISESISKGKEGVSFMQIMEFFENINFDIPSD